MKNTQIFNMKNFIKQMTNISERQLENEAKTANLIKKILSEYNTSYTLQKFITHIPVVIKNSLTADGKEIKSSSTSLKSGRITDKNNIISSLISSQKNINDANINFNPNCQGISRSNHYFAPSLAIAAKDIAKLLQAQKIKGLVQIKSVRHESKNILVGNISKPDNIIFCHYDSFGPGAIDNASGTTLLLKLIISHPKTLKNNLFVIAGNEEISFDFPVYWGHGYRIFEKKYSEIIKTCKKILVVDCVGNGKPIFDNFSSTVKLAFPIKTLERYKKKIYAVYGNGQKLMEVYHSSLDTPDLVEEKFMKQAVTSILKKILK